MIRVDRDEIARAVTLLVEPGTVVELRAPGSRQGTLSGYFDDTAALVAEAERLSGTVPSVYATINPVRPDLLARAKNRVEPYAKNTTGDADVVARRWILIDLDPIRPAGISSLDSEHDAALAVARDTRTWLVNQLGFSADSLVLADSGNGAHVLVRCDLPNTPEETALVRRCLEAVALYRGTETVQVDTTVHNAARISKVYGTLAAKGDSIAERPHRLARVLDAPRVVTPASRILLDRLGALRPADPPRARSRSSTGDEFDVRAWLAGHHVEIVREKPWTNGATVLELDACPLADHEHHRGEAVVILLASGMLLYKCPHHSCAGREWAHLREHFDGRRPARLAPTPDAIAKAPPPDGDPVAWSGSLSDLLDTLLTFLSRYVVFTTPAQRTAVVLWIAHAHTLDAFDVTPYLNARSAEKRSGKTRLLEVLKELVPRPWQAIQPSEAVLFRKIANSTPTLLLDEVDAIFKGPPSDRTEGLRAMLNAGYRRGATVDRCAGKDRDKLEEFPVFCAKMLTGIGTLPDTVSDRCIPVVMVRRKKEEPVARFRSREVQPLAQPIREALTAWAAGAVETLRAARPNMPEALPDRAEEVWEPLVAIADLAGVEWPARARVAAVELNGGAPDTESIGVSLLAAIRAAFDTLDTDKVLTADLLRTLVNREHEPWPGWWGEAVDKAKDGATPRKPSMELARHLKPFGVLPKKLRLGDHTGNGYDRADFGDAFARYCSPLGGVGRNNGTTVAAQGFEPFRPTPGGNEVGTPETLGREGLCRRSDLDPVGRGNASSSDPGVVATDGSEGIATDGAGGWL